MKLESLAALVNGAIAFDSPEESKPAEAEDTFGLYEDLAHSQRGVIIKLELPGGRRINRRLDAVNVSGAGSRTAD